MPRLLHASLNKLAHADFGGQAEQMVRLEKQIAEQNRAQRNRTIGVLLIIFALLYQELSIKNGLMKAHCKLFWCLLVAG